MTWKMLKEFLARAWAWARKHGRAIAFVASTIALVLLGRGVVAEIRRVRFAAVKRSAPFTVLDDAHVGVKTAEGWTSVVLPAGTKAKDVVGVAIVGTAATVEVKHDRKNRRG